MSWHNDIRYLSWLFLLVSYISSFDDFCIHFEPIRKKRTCFLSSSYIREQTANNVTYLLKLISPQAWHVDRTLPNLESDQNALPTEVLNQGDVEAHRKDSHVPIAKNFWDLCVMTRVATAPGQVACEKRFLSTKIGRVLPVECMAGTRRKNIRLVLPSSVKMAKHA